MPKIEPSDLHYRIYDHPEKGLIPVCVQRFDLDDYDRSRLGETQFATETEAQAIIDQAKGLGLRGEIIAAVDKALRALPGTEVSDTSVGWRVARGNDEEFVEL